MGTTKLARRVCNESESFPYLEFIHCQNSTDSSQLSTNQYHKYNLEIKYLAIKVRANITLSCIARCMSFSNARRSLMDFTIQAA